MLQNSTPRYSNMENVLANLAQTKESKDPVLFHPIPLLEIFLFFEIWHFLIKSSDFGDWTHQGGFLC